MPNDTRRTSANEADIARALAAIRSNFDPKTQLLQLVLYERPKDYPDGFIVRAWLIDCVPGAEPMFGPGFGFWTRELALAWIEQEFPQLVRIERQPNDEPQIVAVWT